MLVTGIDLVLWDNSFIFSVFTSSSSNPTLPCFGAADVYLLTYWLNMFCERKIASWLLSLLHKMLFFTAKVARRVRLKPSLPETLDLFQRKSLAMKLDHLVKILLKSFLGRCLSFLPSSILLYKFQFFLWSVSGSHFKSSLFVSLFFSITPGNHTCHPLDNTWSWCCKMYGFCFHSSKYRPFW